MGFGTPLFTAGLLLLVKILLNWWNSLGLLQELLFVAALLLAGLGFYSVRWGSKSLEAKTSYVDKPICETGMFLFGVSFALLVIPYLPWPPCLPSLWGCEPFVPLPNPVYLLLSAAGLVLVVLSLVRRKGS
jgi:hypothetical protein